MGQCSSIIGEILTVAHTDHVWFERLGLYMCYFVVYRVVYGSVNGIEITMAIAIAQDVGLGV